MFKETALHVDYGEGGRLEMKNSTDVCGDMRTRICQDAQNFQTTIP